MLRDSYYDGNPVVLNEEDIADLKTLLSRGTMKAIERHRMLYRIFLRAQRRPYTEQSDNDMMIVLNMDAINQIEKRFFVAEWKHLKMTIESSFIVPFLRRLLKYV